LDQAIANGCAGPFFPDIVGTGCCGPDMCAFTDVQNATYWTVVYAGNDNATCANLRRGHLCNMFEWTLYYVLPVRADL